ncbi:hypothetical protein DFQ02_107169 [Seonamhaeicola aphaedonensis]|uniref:Uncharacterized protein n=2 Tax=Seonamhaeicola aphaedonensis TaxID=1461338 RepID=A0A3D9HA11_9FLAO|nr:hypothetical protein DFQ02_107169 [Seonamhaeicola aphaedonensis]
MSKIQETYKKDSDIILLSLTVMPWRDSVPLLWEYAQNNNVDVKNGI